MSELEIVLWLNQVPNTSKIKELQRRLLEKRFMTMVLLTFWQKGHFLPKNGGTTKTNNKPSICTLISMY